MNSVLLQTATRFIAPLLFIFSILVLLRGHNEPGGGFIGGLLAAAAVALVNFANGLERAGSFLRFSPRTLMVGGVTIALFSGTLPLLVGKPFLTGLWMGGPIPLGTPLLFDTGVYLAVLGVTTNIIFALGENA